MWLKSSSELVNPHTLNPLSSNAYLNIYSKSFSSSTIAIALATMLNGEKKTIPFYTILTWGFFCSFNFSATICSSFNMERGWETNVNFLSHSISEYADMIITLSYGLIVSSFWHKEFPDKQGILKSLIIKS